MAGGAVSWVLAVAVVSAAAFEAPKSFLASDGHAWRALTEGEKLALLTGFLIGDAFEQGMGLSPEQGALPPETFETMRREGRLRFPFAPGVYKARLEDFYFYQDRLSVPLYRALFLINEEILRGARGGR